MRNFGFCYTWLDFKSLVFTGCLDTTQWVHGNPTCLYFLNITLCNVPHFMPPTQHYTTKNHILYTVLYNTFYAVLITVIYTTLYTNIKGGRSNFFCLTLILSIQYLNLTICCVYLEQLMSINISRPFVREEWFLK